MNPHSSTPRSRLNALTASAITLGLAIALAGCSGASPHPTQTAVPLAQYEQQARQFKPQDGLAAINRNDVRQFVYQWFTQFEHASRVDYYLAHLDNHNMSVVVPGMAPLTSHAAFAGWYNNLMAQTLWNFHDLTAIKVEPISSQTYSVDFVIDWYGEVRPDSDQLSGWQSRSDSHLYHRKLRQQWTVKTGDRFLIERLVITPVE
ncbi:hypothetical protein ACW9H6_17430 [Pseudomonas sp. SDO528_S397]